MRAARAPAETIRVAILVESLTVPEWVRWTVAQIEAEEGFSLVSVLLQPGSTERSSRRGQRTYRLYQRLDRAVFGSASALRPVDLTPVASGRIRRRRSTRSTSSSPFFPQSARDGKVQHRSTACGRSRRWRTADRVARRSGSGSCMIVGAKLRRASSPSRTERGVYLRAVPFRRMRCHWSERETLPLGKRLGSCCEPCGCFGETALFPTAGTLLSAIGTRPLRRRPSDTQHGRRSTGWLRRVARSGAETSGASPLAPALEASRTRRCTS